MPLILNYDKMKITRNSSNVKPTKKGGIIMHSTKYVKPKSYISVLRKEPTRYQPENNQRNIETRVKAGKGDTYQLLKVLKDIKAMV